MARFIQGNRGGVPRRSGRKLDGEVTNEVYEGVRRAVDHKMTRLGGVQSYA